MVKHIDVDRAIGRLGPLHHASIPGGECESSTESRSVIAAFYGRLILGIGLQRQIGHNIPFALIQIGWVPIGGFCDVGHSQCDGRPGRDFYESGRSDGKDIAIANGHQNGMTQRPLINRGKLFKQTEPLLRIHANCQSKVMPYLFFLTDADKLTTSVKIPDRIPAVFWDCR